MPGSCHIRALEEFWLWLETKAVLQRGGVLDSGKKPIP